MSLLDTDRPLLSSLLDIISILTSKRETHVDILAFEVRGQAPSSVVLAGSSLSRHTSSALFLGTVLASAAVLPSNIPYTYYGPPLELISHVFISCLFNLNPSALRPPVTTRSRQASLQQHKHPFFLCFSRQQFHIHRFCLGQRFVRAQRDYKDYSPIRQKEISFMSGRSKRACKSLFSVRDQERIYIAPYTSKVCRQKFSAISGSS